jgi:hypothetical protein
MRQSAAFAFGVPHDINGYHPYTVRSTDLSHPQVWPYLLQPHRWAARFNKRRAKPPTYALRPINPDNTRGLRITAAAGTKLATPYSPPTINRALNVRKFPALSAQLYQRKKQFTIRRPSSCTRRRCVRLSPLAQYSRLRPPVGVGPVSQCPRWGSGSHLPYRS